MGTSKEEVSGSDGGRKRRNPTDNAKRQACEYLELRENKLVGYLQCSLNVLHDYYVKLKNNENGIGFSQFESWELCYSDLDRFFIPMHSPSVIGVTLNVEFNQSHHTT